MKKVKEYNKDIIEVLGIQGRMVSGSKSCGPAMAVYNANVGVDGKLVWYGDVDIDRSKVDLIKLSMRIDKDIEVYYERSLRIFPSEATDLAKVRKQKEDIKNKNGMVWSTANPNLFNGKNYAEMRILNQKRRDDAVNQRMIWFGSLTPAGTEWTWYNTWYYKSVYRIYEFIAMYYRVYIGYPCYAVSSSRYPTIWGKVKGFMFFFLKEVGYRNDIQYFIDMKLDKSD